MTTFRELAPGEKRNEVLRWLLVVPGAVLASVVVQYVVGGVIRATNPGGGAAPSDSLSFWVRTGLYHVLPGLALVVAGGWIAPRKRLAAALVLMVVGGALSLLKHVVVQHFAGNAVGVVNYAHFGLDLAGYVAGAVCVQRLCCSRHSWLESRDARPLTPGPSPAGGEGRNA